MKGSIRSAFNTELKAAKSAYRSSKLDEAFDRLERAHIIGQRYFLTHLLTHVWMLRVGLKRLDWREIRGQILRIIAVVPGYIFGWVPKGNTGGADVSAIKPMKVPPELEGLLADYNVWRDVVTRGILWLSVGALTFTSYFLWGVWVRSGETRSIVSAFDGECVQLVGYQGPEDLAIDREKGLIYIVGGDRRSFRAGGPGRAKIWSIPTSSNETTNTTDISPQEPPVFRSFGLDLHIDSKGTRRLFVVNRAEDGHKIEIFRLISPGHFVLENSLRHELLKNPNDVVALGPDSALVTLDKKANAASFNEILEGALQSKTGKVLLIDTKDAKVVASGLQMANGIAFSPLKTELYVGETVGQRISVYKHDVSTHSLEFDRHIPVGTGVDNITVTPSGKVIITGHPKLLTLALGYQKSEDRRSPSEVLVYDPDTSAVERLYTNDGHELSGGSAAILDEQNGRLFIGSAFGPHILRCELDSGRYPDS